MKITSIDKDVKGILGSSYYRIPRFQRPYSWDRDNISDFWDDTIVDKEADYFIGSTVVFEAGGDTFGVVDGQQRLTTITMILCALRNALKKEGFSDLAEGIHQLIERCNIDNKSQYILSTESSFPYFQEYIQKFGDPDIAIRAGDEEKNIESAFSQITTYIDEAVNSVKSNTTLNESTKRERIKELLVSIRDKILGLKLIFVELDDEDDAYVVFETLNTRGKDLSVADLVKNHLTRLIKPGNVRVDTSKIQWERILTTIKGSEKDIDVEGFLHHYWLSKHDYVTVKKLFKEVKKTVRKDNAHTVLKELEDEAKTYRVIHDTASRKWKREERDIKQALDAFSLFRVKQQVPMVLSVMRDYNAGKLNIKDVKKILRAIENFHFVFTAVTSQRSSGGISQMYASAARRLVNVAKKEDKLKVLTELYNKISDKVPSFQEFEANFKEIYFTSNYTKQKKLVRYILSRIDAHHNSARVIDYDAMTVEHLAPQNSVSVSGPNELQIGGQLGNLILVPANLNNKLGNKPFKEKKESLANAGVFLDNIITGASSWDSQQIVRRTKWLANIAYKTIWKL